MSKRLTLRVKSHGILETELEATERLLRTAVVAVINQGQAHLLHGEPEVLAYFGGKMPSDGAA